MKNIQTIIFVLLALFLGIGFTLLHVQKRIAEIPQPAYHEHADFALFVNGEKFDFTLDEFMSTAPCVVTTEASIPVAYAHGSDLDDAVHLHDKVGGVVHTHRADVSWHDFFESLKMDFEDTIFIDHEGNQYRENEEYEFRFMRNGEEVETLQDVEIRDLDRVLISYGLKDRPMEELLIEYAQITNDACFYSETCPHRGIAPYESCGGADAYEKPAVLEWLGV